MKRFVIAILFGVMLIGTLIIPNSSHARVDFFFNVGFPVHPVYYYPDEVYEEVEPVYYRTYRVVPHHRHHHHHHYYHSTRHHHHHHARVHITPMEVW